MTFGGVDGSRWLERLHKASATALYLHIPFCVRKCAYCDFSSWATVPGELVMGEYVASLSRLVDEAVGVGLLAGCETAYVGGGTPSFVGAALAGLVERVRYWAPGIAEFSCEANPDSLTDELLARLAQAGCTRLSVGVQSLNDGELKALGRVHNAERARERLAASVAAGFDVSADLMCATPEQTDGSWMASLVGVVETGVGHVSVYPLQLEEGTPLGERYNDADAPFNDSEVQAHRMEIAGDLLQRAGFARYEVASYALEGKACRHNQAYWTGEPYLGLGTGASSMLAREGYELLRAACPQLPAVDDKVRRVRLTCTDGRHELASARRLADLHFALELLDERQAAAEDLMLGMRLVRGAERELVGHARTTLGSAEVDDALSWCEGRGLIASDGARWRPTEQGWLLGNELYGRLWDLAPGKIRTLEV